MKLSSKNSLFLSIVALLIIGAGCDNDKNKPVSSQKLNCDSCLATQTVVIKKLYKLELSYSQYFQLKEAYGHGNSNMIVFQFVYTKNSTMPITLLGYTSKPGHMFHHGAMPTKSVYLKPIEEVNFAFPDSAILGDQQVRFATIEAYIAGLAIQPDPTLPNETKFIFTPVLDADGRHIRYDICVINPTKCTNSGTPTQPSPPADANP